MTTPAENGAASGPRQAAARRSGRRDHPAARVGPQVAARLEDELTRGAVPTYTPSLPIHNSRYGDRLDYDFYFDIEYMRRHPAIRLPLQWVMGPLAHGEAEVEARTPAEAMFIAQQWQWFWATGRRRVQDEGYSYGRAPTEVVYDVRDGLLVQHSMTTFSARDAQALVEGGKPVGILVRGGKDGERRMWGWREDVPNKSFWYAHLARHGRRQGESQFWAAYRHWRRLAGRKGGEELLDLGMYRLGVPPIVVDHPNRPYTTVAGQKGIQSFGGMTHTRDEARYIAENIEAGAAVACPSTASNGVRDWDVRMIPTGVDGEQLIAYIDHLTRECSKGCGVPPELFEAAQTGSGYSGREIPMEGFLTAQDIPMGDITRDWNDQIGCPLLKWNFGPDAWARITTKPLLDSVAKRADVPAPPPPGAAPPPGQPPEMGPTATMSTDPWTSGSSRLLVNGYGHISPVGRVAVVVPNMAWLSAETDEEFAGRLANMSDRELETLAEGDRPGDGE
jgi:hypothetical protein